MADSLLKQKIHDSLKKSLFSDANDLVDVSDSFDKESVEVVIVSRKFDGLLMREKNELIWNCLFNNLPKDDWSHVSLSVGASPEDVKGI